ncbi:MipA/OmpV family protein [Atlantibacter hermannii]|uniref:MipA/OmpV family protein n=1 Tax=Atlantibacter hermannii TaxID=565 RepID=UPI00289AB6BB|nr:MipA/OmpV family protein [Atlantibacter hermannii]
MMTKITAAGMALVIPFGTAMAADISAGVEGEAQFTPYKSYKTDYSAIPYLGYDNKIVYLDGTEAGVYFVNDDKNEFKARVWYLDVEFDPDNVRQRAMRQLDTRHSTMMAGLSYQRITDIGAFRGEISGDTLNTSNGIIATLAWAGQVVAEPVTIYPQAGVDWYSAKLARYYYGVSERESAASGLNSWSPDSAVAPWLAVAADWKVTPDLHFYLQPRVTFLPSTLRHSPMVDDTVLTTVESGLVWSF